MKLEINDKVKALLQKEKVGPREVYGAYLAQLGSEDSTIAVVDADLGGSLKTDDFKNSYPERYFDVGISEQYMAALGAGLAKEGFKPFINTFAIFHGRAWEIIRNSIAHPHLAVYIVGSHAGIKIGPDGGSHATIEDLAIMRSIPGMTVLAPADGMETLAFTQQMIKEQKPVYMRFGRNALPILYGKDHSDLNLNNTINTLPQIGKYHTIKNGSDLTIFAMGSMVFNAILAANQLDKEGISTAVINASTIKPVDNKAIIEAAKRGPILTVEDHNVYGGMGSAISEAVSQHQPQKIRIHGVYDVFGQSGDVAELEKEYRLDPNSIADEARQFMKNI